MDDPLRLHWDFDDLDASEQRFRELLAGESEDAAARAEFLTQLARVRGLRADFTAADRLLDEAEPLSHDSPLARARVRLERGRVRRSGGDETAALPLFAAAWEAAREAGNAFVAVDAAHMAALVAPDPAAALAWTERGAALAGERPDDAGYWLGPLLNNLGWAQLDSGEPEAALASFEGALRARERDPERRGEIEVARYAVAKALRVLGRPHEAVEQLELAVAWAEGEGKPDGWFHEELALAYAELGRREDARLQATAALPLLAEQDPDWTDASERGGALHALAGAAPYPSSR